MLKTCLYCQTEFEGSPQSRFHSNACRVAYGRKLAHENGQELEQAEPGSGEVEQAAEVAHETLGASSETPERPPSPPLTENEYVEQTLAEALAFSISIGETDAPLKLGTETLVNRRRDRLRRAERYAHWRYQGYLEGKVANL
jgi:hypothetical protein